jgi:hypothetical protein
MILTHIAIRDFPARPGLSFISCVSAGAEPAGKCGVGQLVMAPLAAGAMGKS